MDTIIGLGQAGCAIADKFAEYPQYNIYKIDVGLKRTPTTYGLAKQNNFEDYEKKAPTFSKFLNKLSGDVLFVVGGGGAVSSATLSTLKRIKHCNISILYIKPDMDFLGKDAKNLNNMCLGILQEYARSGVFQRIYLVDNSKLEEILPSVSIKKYYDNLNEAIVSTFHMLNIFNNNKSVTDTFSPLPAATRISTIGFVSPEDNIDNMFFSLDRSTDIAYYYAYSQSRLEEGSKLFSEIKKSIKKKMSDDVRVTYGIFETNYEQDYIYCVKHTSVIQQ